MAKDSIIENILCFSNDQISIMISQMRMVLLNLEKEDSLDGKLELSLLVIISGSSSSVGNLSRKISG